MTWKQSVLFQKITSVCQGKIIYGLICPWCLWVSSTSWEFCSLTSAKWLENLYLNHQVQFSSTYVNSFSWSHWPCVYPTGWNGHIYQFHHYYDGLVCKMVFFRYLVAFQMCTLNGTGNFTDALRVNTKIWTSWFAWFCAVFWVKWIAKCFQKSP